MNRIRALQELDNLFKKAAGFSYATVKELINKIYDDNEVNPPKPVVFKSNYIPADSFLAVEKESDTSSTNNPEVINTPTKIIRNIENIIPILEMRGATIIYSEKFKKYEITGLECGKLNYFTKSNKVQVCKLNEWVDNGIVYLNGLL